MSDMNAGGKVLGLEPPKYVKIAYILLLVSAGIGAVSSLLWMVGVYLGLNGLAQLLGVIGLIMAVVGWLAFKEKFSALELDHLKYICVLFLAFFVLGIILGTLLFATGAMMYVIILLLNLAQVLMLFTGFNSFQHGRAITKDNVQGEVKAALNRS